jgi:trimeric autotransporter adhesin
MFRRIRAHLTYANVMSTIAVVFAIGGASAYAANHLANNSVTSKAIKNGQVKTKDLHNGAVTSAKIGKGAVTEGKLANGAVTGPKIANQAVGVGQIAPNAITNGQIANGAVSGSQIANGAVTTIKLANGAVVTGDIANNAVTTAKIPDGAVTNPKLAPNSVSGLVQIIDGTVTGSDIIENSLTFGCTPTPNVISAAGATGPFQVGGTGSCGFVITSGSHTWAQADAACSGIVPDSTLPSAAQLEQIAQAAGDQSVPTGTTGIWLDAPSAAGSVWTASVDGTAHVSAFASTAITTSSSGPVVCAYQPASKQG